MHWNHIERLLETRAIPDEISENIRKCYRRLYQGENLLGQFAVPGESRLKMALQYCGYYPERESKCI